MAASAELTDKSTPEQGMPDLAEKFNVGELVAYEGTPPEDYGPRNERIPSKYQKIFQQIAEKIALRDMFARITEVRRAGEAGFYWRSVFDAFFDDTQGMWQWGNDAPGGLGVGADTGNIALSYPLNIYQAKGRSFIKMVGHKPGVHFEAAGDAPYAERVSCAAEALRKSIEAYNDVELISQQVARIQWTDGRFHLFTRWVTDGAKCGYYDEDEVDEAAEGLGEGGKPPKKAKRIPKGYTRISVHDVPEVKVPIDLAEQSDFPYLQFSMEIDMSAAKALYPYKAKDLHAGEPGPGEFMFDRTTRIALKQGIHLVSQTGDTVALLPTYQRTWMRPCLFSEIENEEDRGWFEDNFPDGAFVAFVGPTYCESRNETMDDHWCVGHPIVGHGQMTPSYGYSMLTAQDLFNDLIDLSMEGALKSIPSFWGDPEIFDFPAMSKAKAQPGSARPLKSDIDPNVRVMDRVYQEPTYSPSQDAMNLRDAILTKISDIVTGINAPAVGQTDEDNTTFSGIQLLMRASRGESGMAFQQWVRCYRRAMEQAVRIEAHFRLAETDDEGTYLVRSRGERDVLVDLEDLRDGNFWCMPDSDQTYPATFEEKQAALAALTAAAAQGSKMAQDVLGDPRNARVFKGLLGIPGIHVGPDDSEIKQAAEIESLLMQEPVPNTQTILMFKVQAIVSKVKGTPPPPPPDKYAMFKPSIETQKLDIHQAEFQFCQSWLNSPDGQRAYHENPMGFFNVELHALAHQTEAQKAMMQQAQMTAMPQIAVEKIKHPPKSPAESVAFKDLGPSGQLQLAKQAGLDISADVAEDMAGKVMGQSQPQEAPPQNPAENQ